MDEGTQTSLGLVDESDFFGANWLSKYAYMKNTKIYSDAKALWQVLTSSMIDRKDIEAVTNTTIFTTGSYIYLTRYNTESGVLIYSAAYPNKIQYDMSEISIFNSTIIDKLYSNGACEIYRIGDDK